MRCTTGIAVCLFAQQLLLRGSWPGFPCLARPEQVTLYTQSRGGYGHGGGFETLLTLSSIGSELK